MKRLPYKYPPTWPSPHCRPKVRDFELNSSYISWMEGGEGNLCRSCSPETHRGQSEEVTPPGVQQFICCHTNKRRRDDVTEGSFNSCFLFKLRHMSFSTKLISTEGMVNWEGFQGPETLIHIHPSKFL